MCVSLPNRKDEPLTPNPSPLEGEGLGVRG